jgi:hypothetical protein
MPSTPPVSPIPVPKVDIDEPVAVIPLASVAPLDGPADGERINTFALAPQRYDTVGAVRNSVIRKPFTFLLAAFSLGYVLARVLR